MPGATETGPEPRFDRGRRERESLAAAGPGLAWFIDGGVVSLANTLLVTLAGFALVHPDWQRVLLERLTGIELDEARNLVETRRRWFRWDDPIGAVPHGTRLFGDVVVDLGVHRRQLAIELLGITGRLVLGGHDRGECIVVLSAEQLSAASLGVAGPRPPL